MHTSAELLPKIEIQETVSRRTDDILFNVYHLHRHMEDKERGVFDLEAEADVLEQDLSGIGESDIHKLGVSVYQKMDSERGQYVSLDDGTVDIAINGLLTVDTLDEANLFEFFRNVEEVTDEEAILRPDVQTGMRKGGIKVFVSPSPTHHEADPDVAAAFRYDDRTMFRLQLLSKDGQTKRMISFSVFDAPASAWAAFLSNRYGVPVEPTALGVMQFCNQVDLEYNSVPEILRTFIGGVADYVEDENRSSVEAQLESFLHEQDELEAEARFYAEEKLKIQKELARSLNGWAQPAIERLVGNVYDQLKEEDRQQIDLRRFGGRLKVDDYVARLVMRIKTLTTANRAGLATLNERTVKRVASRVGLETAIFWAQREQAIQRTIQDGGDPEFMIRRSDQLIAKSGVNCGGGCEVDIVGLFASEASTAEEAGLSGTLYTSKELDKNSKCNCAKNNKKAKVISDGRNVVCVNCGEFEVNGQRGFIKAKKKAA